LTSLFLFLQPFSPGQSTKAESDVPAAAKSGDGTVALSGTNAALLKELESMRARIEELEQQLKRQAGSAASANEVTPSAEQDVTSEVAALTLASTRSVEKVPSPQQVSPRDCACTP
jgi:hypothetical protein